MVTETVGTPSTLPRSGIFVRGTVISTSAVVRNRKNDGGKLVIVRHEIAIRPGLALWERFLKPEDGEVTLRGDELVDYPKLPELEEVTIHATRFKVEDGRMVINDGEVVGH